MEKLTVREFLLGLLYARRVSRGELLEVFETAREKGLILLGGREDLERELRLLEAIGALKEDREGHLSLDTEKLHPETRTMVKEKAMLIERTRW